MDKNKVHLTIGAGEYVITTEDDVDYVEALGEEMNQKMEEVSHSNPRLSQTQAAILVALDYADQSKKAVASADNLRAQIKDYLEDSARARMEADVARREIERLNREMSAMRMKLANSGKNG